MKFVADVLTFSRFLFALGTVAAVIGGNWGLAVVLFTIGILTDAFDGPIARRWPYTAEEEKKFFWRAKDPHMWDNAADLTLSTCGLLAVVYAVFGIAWWSLFTIGIVALVSACFVGALEIAARSGRPKLAERIDVVHGWVFGIELLTMLVVLTVMATDTWPYWAALYSVATIVVVIAKWDRVTSRAEVDYSR